MRRLVYALLAVTALETDYLFTAEWDFNRTRAGVKVYDSTTWQQIATLDNYNFPWTGNFAMGEGRMDISPDGRWLAVSVANGVRLYDVSAFGGVTPIPEPSSIVLTLMGSAAGLGVVLRRVIRNRTAIAHSASSAPRVARP